MSYGSYPHQKTELGDDEYVEITRVTISNPKDGSLRESRFYIGRKKGWGGYASGWAGRGMDVRIDTGVVKLDIDKAATALYTEHDDGS